MHNKIETILVTGGAGFIGSHLIARLLQDGIRVLAIDDLSTGSLENIKAFRPNSHFKFEQSTLSKSPLLESWIESSDYVVHLAAAVGVELVVASPIRTIRTNLDETSFLLDAASRIGSTPVLLASTSEVYGKSNLPDFSEDDDLIIGPPTFGRWSYACSKLMDEFLALAYAREKCLPLVITRFFNTVGPRQTGKYGMVVPRFIEAATHGHPLRVYGDGDQSRCFCYVEDTVESLIRLMQCPEASGQIFNIGTTEEVSIRCLAERIIELTGSKSEIQQVSYDTAYGQGFQDMRRRRPNVQKLNKYIGFQPAISLDETIRRIVVARIES
ncbi:MAG TPA: NAD-dependent epimerase/dehydratase family protein [Verrucomicrobiales bacterium]|nr:NAD-dependent epimerase/dehydratase family protein [Verrucomicrobiales bacterium]